MSAEKSSFVKQAAILAVAGLVVRFLGFLYRLPLTEMIGDLGNGIYSAGYNIYNFLLILSSAGLPAAISKMVSERRAQGQYANAHRVFRVALNFALIAGSLAAITLWLGAEYITNAIKSPRSYYAILTLAPTVFIVSIMSVFRGYFQGMQNTVPTAFSQVIEQLFNAVFSVVLCHIFITDSLTGAIDLDKLDKGVAGGTAGTGVGAFAGLLVMISLYTLVKPRIHSKIRKDKSHTVQKTKAITLELLRTAIPIIAGTAIFSIASLIDTKMVMDLLVKSGFSEDDAYYNFGLLSKYILVSTLPVSIATALSTAVVPNIAASYVLKDMEAVRHKVNLGFRVTMLFSIPAAIGLGVLGDQIILLLFPSHSDGGALLKIGALSIIFLAISQIATGMLQGISMVIVPVIAALSGALVKIPLNMILIPISEINVIGAVLSTTGCYLVAAGINFTVLFNKTKVVPDFIGIFVKPLAASALMGLACYSSYKAVYLFIPNNTLGVIVSIFIGIVVYFVFMILFNGIKRNDIRMMPFGKKLALLMEEYNLG